MTLEYDIKWIWLPELPKLSRKKRLAKYDEIVGRHVGRERWAITPECREKLDSPTERERSQVVDGVAGWLTRVEIQREFIKT